MRQEVASGPGRLVPHALAIVESTAATVFSTRSRRAALRLLSFLAILHALGCLTDDAPIEVVSTHKMRPSRSCWGCVVTIRKFEDSYEGLDRKTLHQNGENHHAKR